MAEQTDFSGAGSASEPPLAAGDEDAGRLDGSSRWTAAFGLAGGLWGLGFGFYFGSNPNLLIGAVPASRQGVSGGMNAVFGSIGSAVGIALFTALVAAHPLKLVAAMGGHSFTQTVPGVYTDTGYVLSYIVAGIVPAAIALILTLFLRGGRTPARGGAAELVADAPVAEATGGAL